MGIKVLSNNFFIIVSNYEYRVTKIQTLGSLGTVEQTARFKQAFGLLVKKLLTYISDLPITATKKIRIEQLKLDGVSMFFLKELKTRLESLQIKYCKFIEK